MIELPRGLVVAERITPDRWLVHADRTTEHLVHSGDAADVPEATQLAQRLAADYGGVAVRCIVFVTEHGGSSEPLLVTAYPRQVHVITRNLALAHAASLAAPRFLLITEGEPLSASLFTRTRDGFSEHVIRQATCERVSESAAALGIEHFVVSTTAPPSTSVSEFLASLPEGRTIELLPDHSHIVGAARYAARLSNGDGVWEDAGGTSRLTSRQSISYAIHRPSLSVFDPGESALADVVGKRPVLLTIDKNVNRIYGDAIQEYARRRLNVCGTVLISPHDADKTWQQVERVCATAVRDGLDRRGIIVAIGGGVTLDLSGLAAALFRRGIGYVRVASTLVGQVDVSIGIKQAVNACGRKNLLGAYYAPIASINDYSLLRTLPSSEVACGLAEVVKIALVRDARLFDDVERHGAQLVSQPAKCASKLAREIWYRAECLMLEELSTNLFESSLVRLVDFGHTFSPTIETSSGYRVPHGEAVALDMLLSTGIAVHQGVCDPGLFYRLAALLRALQLPTWSSELLPAERLWSALASSRLHRGGDLNLVAPVSAGTATVLQAVTAKDLANSVAAMREESSGEPFNATNAGVA